MHKRKKTKLRGQQNDGNRSVGNLEATTQNKYERRNAFRVRIENRSDDQMRHTVFGAKTMSEDHGPTTSFFVGSAAHIV